MKYGKRKRWYHHVLDWILDRIVYFKWMVRGAILEDEISDTESEEASEAQQAVDRVVWETEIAPDCVSAMVLRGGACIYVKTDGEHEAFIAESYGEAADKAIAWINLQGEYMESQAETSTLNRKARRTFDSQRKNRRGGRKPGEKTH